MDNKFKFTKRKIESLSILDKTVTYHDTDTTGLKLTISKAGTYTFFVYRKIMGTPERIKLGNFPSLTVEQAKKKADVINAAIAQGKNPNAVKREDRAELTLNDLFEEYMERYAKVHKKSWLGDQQQFDRYLNKLKALKLSKINMRDIQSLHSSVGKNNGVYSANRLLALLKTLFNKATEWGYWEKANPCIGITKFKEKSRERFLQADEIPRFFQAVAEEPNESIRDYILISLLTGARKANVLAMKWDQIYLERRTWEIPETKNGDSHTVPLVKEVIDILTVRKSKMNSEWVFPGTGVKGHLADPKKGWIRILEKADIQNLRLHDLRRSLGSWQASTGASLSVIGKTLAHKNISTTAIYARLNIDPVRESMEKATSAMMSASKKKADVLSIK